MAKPKTIGSVNAKLWLNKHGHGKVYPVKTKEGELYEAKCMGPGICDQCIMEQLIVDLLAECDWLLGLDDSFKKKAAPVKPSIREEKHSEI